MPEEQSILLSIVNSCKNGEQAGFKELYKHMYSFGKSICFRHTFNQQDAEELLNDIFLKIFKNLHKYDFDKPFKAWFRTIAVNTCIDFYRTSSKMNFIDSSDYSNMLSVNPEILDKISYTELLAIVQEIPLNYRNVFLLFVVEGFTHKEIAEKLGINEITCRTSLNKARNLLQNLLLKK